MTVPLERVIDVVRGHDTSMSRGEAFAILASEAVDGKEGLLASVVEDSSEPSSVRSAAAVMLGRILSPDAEDALLRLAGEADPQVLPDILRSLGPIASPAALLILDGLAVGPGGPVDTAARFAATLISHRHRLQGHDVVLPGNEEFMASPGVAVQPIDFGPTPDDHASRVLEDVTRQPFGNVTFTSSLMSDIRCQDRLLTLCLNREIIGINAADGVTASKAVLGVVALKSPETGNHSVAYVILSAPSSTSGAINLFVLRRSGNLILAGSARTETGALRFELRSLRRPGAAPVLLQGLLEQGELRVEEAVTSTVRLPGREPAFLEPAARPAMALDGEVR